MFNLFKVASFLQSVPHFPPVNSYQTEEILHGDAEMGDFWFQRGH